MTGAKDFATLPLSSVQREPIDEYRTRVEREEEMGRLLSHAKSRKSLLIFGPEGVGKSRLLQTFVACQSLALYVGQIRSPRDLVLTLLHVLHSADDRIRVPGNAAALSACSLKGIVHRALDTKQFLIVLDQLEAPSSVVTGIIKDLHYYGRTPVISASRCPHMENIGALRPLCANKSERLELKNLPHPIALEFARRNAERIQLWASNTEAVLPSFVEWSNGNRGSILVMLKMAHLPQYRMDDQIKAHILYVDYRMGRPLGRRDARSQ